MIGLGTQSQLGIGIAIQLRDQFSVTADRVTRKLMDLKKMSNSALDGALSKYRNTSAGIAATAGAITYGFYGMAKSASEFGHQINQMDILGDGKLGKTKKQLSEFTLGLAADFATMPTKVGALMTDNIRQGVNQGLDMVSKYQLAVSKATNETPEVVGKSLLGIMHAYNMTTDQFPRIANAVTATANATQSSVYSIGESMEYTGFTARRLNLDLEHTLAFMGKLSQSGIMGSSAGVAMNQMQLELAKGLGVGASKKKIAAWNALGLDRGQMKAYMNEANGLFKVSEAIEKASSKINSVDREKILFDLLGVRGAKGMSGAWGQADPSKSLSGLLASAQGGVGSNIAMTQAKRMMNDPYSQFLKIQAKWEVFKIKFIGSMAPVLGKILHVAEKFIDVATAIGQSPIGTVLGSIIAVGAPLIGTLFAFRAAALTATIALRGFGAMGLMGPGFGALMRAGLGGIGPRAAASGYGVLSRSSPAYLKQFAKNSAGNWYVRAGQQANINGKLYGAGSALPRNFNPAMGGYLHPSFNALGKNAAGNWYVRAGQSFTHGGKTFGAGSMLPRGINPTVTPRLGLSGVMAGASVASMGSSAGAAATWASRVGLSSATGVASKILPTLGKIAMFGGRLLPIVGWGLTIYSIYDLLKGEKKEKKAEEEDPGYKRYKQAMDSAFWGGAGRGWENMSPAMKEGKEKADKAFNQTLQIHIDGRKVMEQNIQQQLSESMNNYLPFNVSEY